MVNFTVRVDADMKRQAEIACEYLNTTLSDMVRQTLNQVIRQYYQTHEKDTQHAANFMRNENSRLAHKLVVEFMAINGDKLIIGEDGKLVLNEKFRK